jgi:hypothetical protein
VSVAHQEWLLVMDTETVYQLVLASVWTNTEAMHIAATSARDAYQDGYQALIRLLVTNMYQNVDAYRD